MPTIIEQPGQRALHLPAVLHDLKALASVLHHFQINLMRLFTAAHPIVQPRRLIASVDPELA